MDDDRPEVARSYAEALVNAAENAGQADAVLDDLDAIRADVLLANPRFAAILGSPSVPRRAEGPHPDARRSRAAPTRRSSASFAS